MPEIAYILQKQANYRMSYNKFLGIATSYFFIHIRVTKTKPSLSKLVDVDIIIQYYSYD